MPVKDTMYIDLGNWIIAFYVVYVITGVAVLSALGLLTGRINSIISRRRLVRRNRLTQSSLARSM